MNFSLPDFQRTPRYMVDAPVVAHERIVGHEFEIVFLAPNIARSARPGQFVELLFGDNYAPLMRRPFSLYRVDPDAGTFRVVYLARGAFTSGLAQKRTGDIVSILGPLGRPFSAPLAPEMRPLLIAGGIGAPPLTFLARELARYDSTERPPITVINGARSSEMLVGVSEFTAQNIELHLVTDDGSQGRQARVTDVLTELLEAEPDTTWQLYACGPTAMLRSVAQIALQHRLPCQISVETAMPCGIGTCNGCAIAVRDPTSPEGIAYARACWDGPVFEAYDLVW